MAVWSVAVKVFEMVASKVDERVGRLGSRLVVSWVCEQVVKMGHELVVEKVDPMVVCLDGWKGACLVARMAFL